MAERILIVDDDDRLASMLRRYLGERGFYVETRPDGLTGLDAAGRGGFDAVVLDVMMPDIDGFEVLRRLRTRSMVPVLMLTARGEDMDRIVGLEMGADDYLPKPFNPRELVARIRAILRRADERMGTSGLIVEIGDVHLDVGARTTQRAGDDVHLTAVEFEVLEKLMRVAGRVVSRERLTLEVLDRWSAAGLHGGRAERMRCLGSRSRNLQRY